jgi:hypothetical protein
MKFKIKIIFISICLGMFSSITMASETMTCTIGKIKQSNDPLDDWLGNRSSIKSFIWTRTDNGGSAFSRSDDELASYQCKTSRGDNVYVSFEGVGASLFYSKFESFVALYVGRSDSTPHGGRYFRCGDEPGLNFKRNFYGLRVALSAGVGATNMTLVGRCGLLQINGVNIGSLGVDISLIKLKVIDDVYDAMEVESSIYQDSSYTTGAAYISGSKSGAKRRAKINAIKTCNGPVKRISEWFVNDGVRVFAKFRCIIPKWN